MDESRRASRARHVAGIFARSFLAVLALVAAALVALVVYSRTAPGLRVIERRIEAAVSDAMAGSMEIEELTSMWPARVRARGVVFRDPEGRPVIAVDRAAIALDGAALLRRRLVFRSAKVDGGRVSIESHGEELGVERAFASGREPPRGGGRRRLDVDLDNLHVHGVRLEVDAANAPRVVLEDVQGFLAVRLEPDEPVRIRLDRVSAKLATSRRFDVRFENIRGEIRAKAAKAVDLEFGGTIGGDAMQGALRYFPHREPAAEIDLDVPDPSMRTAMMSLGLGVAGRISPSLRVERSLGDRLRRRDAR